MEPAACRPVWRQPPPSTAIASSLARAAPSWLIGPQGLPGAFAIGAWDQTGQLTLKGPNGLITQDGSQGIYMFASQRLWRASPAGDGVSGFIQFGVNNSRTTFFATRYFGFGLTGFGLIPGQAGQSFGAGLAWSRN